jgi:hypothetical protein
MKSPDARKLLGGYATGTLTKGEREALLRAALEDQALFEELVEEEDWRAALGEEAFRLRLRRRLRELAPARTSWSDRLGISFRYRWLALGSAVAALAVVLLIRQGVLTESSPVAQVVLGPGAIPALHTAGLLEEPGAPERRLEEDSRTAPPRAAEQIALNLDRGGRNPVYRVGDRQRIGFKLAHDASVLLLEERADGSSVRLFPNRFQSSPAVRGGETVLVPPAGQGDLEVDGPAGARTLRLLVFPSDRDPLTSTADWREFRGGARVAEEGYQVKP